jgi:hypothetical protein
MNVDALRRRPAQERSNSGLFWMLKVDLPDFHNWMKRFSIFNPGSAIHSVPSN